MEGDVVVEQEVVARAGNGRVPFPRKVGELGVALVVAGEEVLELLGVGPSVDNFQGVDAGDRVAGDVPRVVESRLNRGQADSLELAQDFGQVLEEDAAHLNVLARRDVGAAVAAVAGNDIADDPQLLGGDHPVGDPQAHHEQPRGLGPPEHAVPLQAQLKVGLVDVFPAQLGEFFNLTANKQTIFGCFVLLDLVELFAFEPAGQCAGGIRGVGHSWRGHHGKSVQRESATEPFPKK